MGIKHRADSGLRKFSVLIKLGFGRTVKRFEMPYVSYPRPLGTIQKKRRNETNFVDLKKEIECTKHLK